MIEQTDITEYPQVDVRQDVDETLQESRRYGDNVAALQSIIGDLEQRLAPILRPDEDASKLQQRPHPVLVPLANDLFVNNEQLDMAIQRLRGMISRIAL